jgi:hypothetical protein
VSTSSRSVFLSGVANTTFVLTVRGARLTLRPWQARRSETVTSSDPIAGAGPLRAARSVAFMVGRPTRPAPRPGWRSALPAPATGAPSPSPSQWHVQRARSAVRRGKSQHEPLSSRGRTCPPVLRQVRAPAPVNRSNLYTRRCP